jgi:prepilin-type N-terminal cleavage/methylation domain-containing protein
MNANWIRRVDPLPFGRGITRANSNVRYQKKSRRTEGFTLVELLITLTIIPLVVGALSLGIIAVFSLNTQTSHRLTDSADAQVVASTYQKDISSAGYITTVSTSSPQCGAGIGTQLLSLESVPNQKTGDFQSVISYVGVPVNNGSVVTTYTLERLLCQNGSTTPTSEFTLAYDLPTPTSATAPLTPPTITCSTGASPSICSGTNNICQQCATGYVPAQAIGSVNFGVTEPSSNYNFNLDASPAASSSFDSGGVASTPAGVCESTAGSTGPFAGSLCLIDFSGLLPNQIAVAETPGQCFNMSVAVGTSDILHFCLGVTTNNSNEGVVATGLPSDTFAGLGQTVYPGLPNDPALYMNPYISQNTTMTISLSAFSVVNAKTGQPVTGWDFISADAETTNSGEATSWTSNVPLTILNDAEAGAPNPDGNACPLTSTKTATTFTVTCNGNLNSENAPLTGAAMVMMSGTNLNSLVVNMNNFQAVAFGMITNGS